MSKNISGIDVSKHELVLYAIGKYFSIPNDKKELQSWFNKNKELADSIDKFVYEPTGGYEKTLETFLLENKYPVYRVHANHVRSFAKASGRLAKTDTIDAKIISEFASLKTTQLTIPGQNDPILVALTSRREQLIEMLKQEQNRLETLTDIFSRRSIKQHSQHLEKQIKATEAALKSHIKEDNNLKVQVMLASSIPGVGVITAVTVLGYLPEIKMLEPKALSSLAGLAPMNNDSGKRTGKRRIQAGRPSVRRVLYMAALSAIKWNADCKVFYERLRAKGKIFKVAITAVMRKLLTMIRSVLIRETAWQKVL